MDRPTGGSSMIIVLPVFVVLGTILRRRRCRRRRHMQLDRLLPDAIDMIAATLRAGYSPTDALVLSTSHMDPALRPSFEAAVRELNDGGRFRDALYALKSSLGSRVQPLVDALDAGHRLGVPLDEVVDRLSHDAHAVRRRQLESSSKELAIELSLPLVVCVLPSFLLLVIVPTLIGTLSRLDLSF